MNAEAQEGFIDMCILFVHRKLVYHSLSTCSLSEKEKPQKPSSLSHQGQCRNAFTIISSVASYIPRASRAPFPPRPERTSFHFSLRRVDRWQCIVLPPSIIACSIVSLRACWECQCPRQATGSRRRRRTCSRKKRRSRRGRQGHGNLEEYVRFQDF